MREIVVDLRRVLRHADARRVGLGGGRRAGASNDGAMAMGRGGVGRDCGVWRPVACGSGGERRRIPGNPLANATFTRFTDFEGAEEDAAISRDGRFVVFRSDRDGPMDTWVSQVGSNRFLNITHGARSTVLVRNAGLTPDGADIWLSAINGGDRLRLAPLLGGSQRPFLPEHAMNPAWSPDGSRLVFHLYDPSDPMLVADRDGSNAREIFRTADAGDSQSLSDLVPRWTVDLLRQRRVGRARDEHLAHPSEWRHCPSASPR